MLLFLFGVIPVMEEQLEVAREFWKSATRNYEEGLYTAAAVDYAKAVFAVIDYFIIKKVGIKPDSHKKRFDIVFYRFREIYPYLKEIYDVYREAYSALVSKERCEEVKENAKKIIEKFVILEKFAER